MSKRFTDSKKWKNEWFLDLPLKAKLAWGYLCDECELTGIWKANYKLAAYQLGFPVSAQLLRDWFEDKIFVLDKDKILIVQFFEFQYGDSKDTWSAKVKAKSLLESYGFQIENNKVLIKKDHYPPTVVGLSKTVLIKGVGIVEGGVKGIKGGVGEKELEQIYKEVYPLKKGKSEGIKFLIKDLSEKGGTADDVRKAAMKYRNEVQKEKTQKKYIKHFSTFAHHWRDWLDDDAGTTTVQTKNYENERETDHDAELKEMWES